MSADFSTLLQSDLISFINVVHVVDCLKQRLDVSDSIIPYLRFYSEVDTGK